MQQLFFRQTLKDWRSFIHTKTKKKNTVKIYFSWAINKTTFFNYRPIM